MKPRISICIPSYNYGRFVRCAINSCLAQTSEPYEIIVSDNCSTDGTGEILTEFKDFPRVRLIRPPRHLEFAEHHRFVIGEATGTHLVCLSADDALHPEFIKVMTEKMMRTPELGLLACASFQCNSRMRPFSVGGLRYPRGVLMPPQAFLRMIKGCCYLMSGAVWSAAALRAVPPLDNSGGLATDWYWALCVGSKFPVEFIHRPLCYYRFHDSNFSHSGVTRWQMQALSMLENLEGTADVSEGLRVKLKPQIVKLRGIFDCDRKATGKARERHHLAQECWDHIRGCNLCAKQTVKRMMLPLFGAHPSYLE